MPGCVEFDFTSPAQVSSGAQYAIVAYTDDTTTTNTGYNWFISNPEAAHPPYSGGAPWSISASPPVRTLWSAFGDPWDFAFRTYVRPTIPTITTTSSGTAYVGGTISDTATLTGGNNPGGTVTFNLYNNPNETGSPLFADTESLVNGVATSAVYTPLRRARITGLRPTTAARPTPRLRRGPGTSRW